VFKTTNMEPISYLPECKVNIHTDKKSDCITWNLRLE